MTLRIVTNSSNLLSNSIKFIVISMYRFVLHADSLRITQKCCITQSKAVMCMNVCEIALVSWLV